MTPSDADGGGISMETYSGVTSADDCAAICSAESAFDCIGFLWKDGSDHSDASYPEFFAQVCSTLDTLTTTPTGVLSLESWSRD